MLVGKRKGKTKNLFADIFVITNDYKHITKLYHPQTCMFSELTDYRTHLTHGSPED